MLTIVWDVDDVLNDLMRVWLAQAWSRERPDRPTAYEQLRENPPHRILGIPPEDYLASLDAFRHTESCTGQPPDPEVMSWFREHGHRFRHIALSAVPLHAAHRSAFWVLGTYGRWIRSFHFVPSPRPGDPVLPYERDKGEWLARQRGADIFIDDSEANVEAARAAGIRAILFPRPWNRAAARTVGEILQQLAAEDRFGAN